MKKLLDLSATIAGSGFVFLALLTTLEVLLRKFFNRSFAGVDEIGGYIYAIGTAIGFVVAFADNAHIRIDFIVKRFPAAVRLALSLISHSVLAFFAALLTWRAGAEWLRSWELGALAPTPLGTPLVWPQGIWLVCLSIFALAVLAKIFAGILRIFSRGIRNAALYLDIDNNAELESEIASSQHRNAQESNQ